MFEVGWSELLVVGIVALIVVGPKELPALLRTIGRYAGMMRRQANEFRAQFDEAMREAEIDQLKKDMESIRSETEQTLRSAESSVQSELSGVKREIESATDAATKPAANGSEPALPVEGPAAPLSVTHEAPAKTTSLADSAPPPGDPDAELTTPGVHGLNGSTAPQAGNPPSDKGA